VHLPPSRAAVGSIGGTRIREFGTTLETSPLQFALGRAFILARTLSIADASLDGEYVFGDTAQAATVSIATPLQNIIKPLNIF